MSKAKLGGPNSLKSKYFGLRGDYLSIVVI